MSAVPPSMDRCRSSRPPTAKEAWRLVKMMRHRREERLVAILLPLFPGAACLIPRCNPAFDRSAWLHYLRQWKATAFSCLSLEQGVMNNGTRATRSNPARGKPLTRGRSILQPDRPDYDALSASTRHPPGAVPLSTGSIRRTTERGHTWFDDSIKKELPHELRCKQEALTAIASHSRAWAKLFDRAAEPSWW